jgi:hypothetical protein
MEGIKVKTIQENAHMNSMVTLYLEALPMNIGIKTSDMVALRIASYIRKIITKKITCRIRFGRVVKNLFFNIILWSML